MHSSNFNYHKPVLLTLLLVVLFSFSACNKTRTVYCPKMPDAFDEWLPYKVNDSLIFKNSKTSEVLRSAVKSIAKSAAYERTEKNRILSNKVSCVGSTYIETHNRNFNINFNVDLARQIKNRPANSAAGGEVMMNVAYGYFRFYLSKKDSTDNIEISDYYTSDVITPLQNFNLNNKLYNDVIILQKDTNLLHDSSIVNKKSTWKMVLAKNHGLIAYYTRGSNQEWVKQ